MGNVRRIDPHPQTNGLTQTMDAMIDEYLETRITTATAHQLHLMIVDGAIRYALTAETALGQQNQREADAALDQARGFVSELLCGLDPTRFPQMVDRLKALFVYIHNNLVKAGASRDEHLVKDAVTILRMYRETWLALADKLKQEAPAETSGDNESRYSWAS
jgi:flagellar protein FliS